MVDEMLATTSTPSASKSARGNNNGVDKLSSLCDELLHHVMSFLPMLEVVRTSLLSPRWRNLWASTPFIYIDYQDFKDENRSCVDEDKLDKFGNNLLLLRDGAVSLDEARIFLAAAGSRMKSEARRSKWIRHAIEHKVRLLHVSGSLSSTFASPAMFPSQHLKIIRLHSIFLSQGSFMPLNHECPLLEHLELEDCECDVEEISSRSLKVLRIIHCVIVYGLLISACNLIHLYILGPVCHSGVIGTRDLSSLVTASVNLLSEDFHFPTSKMVYGHRLLDGLSHATTLELHAPLHELAFERGLQTCSMFSNLTRLVLGDWCMAGDLYPLLRILQRSSKLKDLNLKLNMVECSFCRDSESALLSSRGALSATESCPSLERIKICCRKDDPRIDALVSALRRIMNSDGKICIDHC
ncbi:unnamed protein product [Alopecurus aequalis]